MTFRSWAYNVLAFYIQSQIACYLNSLKKVDKGSGIYVIRNMITGHTYIGMSKNVKRRWQQHRSSLRKNKHHNKNLQQAWNKYGEGNFVFYQIENVWDESMLHQREKAAIYNCKPEYNIKRS